MPEKQHQIEGQLRELLPPPLSPHLRNRVLDSCEAAQHQAKLRGRRANWRLAYGFATLCAIHWIASGLLDAQQQAILGGQANSSTRYASTSPEHVVDIHTNLMLRSRLLAELTEPHSDRIALK